MIYLAICGTEFFIEFQTVLVICKGTAEVTFASLLSVVGDVAKDFTPILNIWSCLVLHLYRLTADRATSCVKLLTLTLALFHANCVLYQCAKMFILGDKIEVLYSMYCNCYKVTVLNI
jgi:hypothetical protein